MVYQLIRCLIARLHHQGNALLCHSYDVSPLTTQVRTAFNILGPLLNPADAAYGLIGVYSPAISGLMAATLQRLGTKRALVVHSHGLDELTPMGDAEILEVTPNGTRSYRRASEATICNSQHAVRSGRLSDHSSASCHAVARALPLIVLLLSYMRGRVASLCWHAWTECRLWCIQASLGA